MIPVANQSSEMEELTKKLENVKKEGNNLLVQAIKDNPSVVDLQSTSGHLLENCGKFVKPQKSPPKTTWEKFVLEPRSLLGRVRDAKSVLAKFGLAIGKLAAVALSCVGFAFTLGIVYGNVKKNYDDRTRKTK